MGKCLASHCVFDKATCRLNNSEIQWQGLPLLPILLLALWTCCLIRLGPVVIASLYIEPGVVSLPVFLDRNGTALVSPSWDETQAQGRDRQKILISALRSKTRRCTLLVKCCRLRHTYLVSRELNRSNEDIGIPVPDHAITNIRCANCRYVKYIHNTYCRRSSSSSFYDPIFIMRLW